MKEFSRKVLALTLALTLVFALAACGPKNADGEGDPIPTPTAAPTDDLDSLGVAFLPDNATDVTMKILGYPGNTTLFTVNGSPVTAEEYLYWLANMTDYYGMMASMYYGSFDLDEVIDDEGTTWGEQLKSIAYDNSVLLAVAIEAAAQQGITLDQTDIDGIIQQRVERIESAGDETVYAGQLQSQGINDRTLFRIDRVATLLEKVEGGYTAETVTDADLAAYVEEEGILRAKHILLLTKDPTTNEEYDDAKKAEQKTKAEGILAQLRDDPAKFDDLMNENSEDTGLATYPDGYLFGPGEMVSEFENGVRALAVGGISDLVQSSYGYHIILRLDPDCDEARENCATWKFNSMMNEWVDNAVVEVTPEYEALSTKDYYEALTAYRQSLEEPVTDDQSGATLEPQPAEGQG